MKARSQIIVMSGALLLASVVFGSLALGDVVFNGSSSLPHAGYFMYRTTAILPRGSYVHFPAPDGVAEPYRDLSFVKRVVGVPGDLVQSDEAQVCINGHCRALLPAMITKGYKPLGAGPIPDGFIAVLGDAENSLDSRYATIGLIARDQINAVGFPIAIPHWKDLLAWQDG